MVYDDKDADIDWVESSDKWTEYESESHIGLSDVLYGASCKECGEALYWEHFDPDPDEPSWGSECCGHSYRAYVSRVTLTCSDSTL